MLVPFFPPPGLLFRFAGPEEAKEPSGGEVLRLIQIRLATPSLNKPHLFVKHNRRKR